MKKALLVIDMQEVCVGKNHTDFFKYDIEKLLPAVNEVITENEGNRIVYIRNLMKRNIINKFAPFEAYEGTKEVELVENMKITGDVVFDKYTGDAFSNEKLNEFLKKEEIDTVELVGVDGGGCVALTAFGALKNGYLVILNTKAIGTTFEKNRKKLYKKLLAKGVQIEG